MKTLIIAEKPSVAADIAKALGKFQKKDDYYENDTYVISSAVGHLVELFMPQDIDDKLKSWSPKTLPILPEKFDLKPIEKTEKKFNALKKLIKRKDVSELVNACDAGREGELIFTYIYDLSKCKKPFKRLWLMSMTAGSIRDSFKHLRTQEDMLPLQSAARCRSESDWLIGINGTRALTACIYGGPRLGKVATVGRVQTPTLTMVVEREKQIKSFKPRDYWRIIGDFGLKAGDYEGLYQKPNFKKGNDEHDRVDRIWDKSEAEKILKELRSEKTGTVTEEKKRSTQAAPRLYDLTTLQREANSRFGMAAGRTLQIAQALYEKHKMITYPRTGSKALPEDYGDTCIKTLQKLHGDLEPHAQKVIKENWVKTSNKRIFNNKQVTDHFAIIPTPVEGHKLAPDEAKIYDMIARRFIAIFHPSAEFDVTTRMTTVGEHTFKTEGKVLVKPGWLAVHGKATYGKEALPEVSDKDGSPAQAKINDLELTEDTTKPPARFTEATLLGAMETAGKLVEDEELAEAMKDSGLGTPATRAQIIEHLVRERYMDRSGRELIPTSKAENLIEFLEAVPIEGLTCPTMTGEWEHKLQLISEGKLSREDFMKGISKLTEDMVERSKSFDETKSNVRETSLKSPIDGAPLIETIQAYRSESGDFSIRKIMGNRKMEEAEIRTLIEKRKVGPLDGFRSRSGKPFSAILELNDENKVRFVFDNGDGDDSGADQDLSECPVIGECPKAKRGLCDEANGKVRETVNAYICEHNKKDSKCNFRVSRILLERTIPPEQFKKLLETGKTDLLDKFRSKRTKRFFSAHLILKDDGNIGFEFAPKKADGDKKAAPKKKAATKKAATKKVATKKATKKKTTKKKQTAS
tara:strand:+ start:14914 stop:17502 length:2589 start_codon:yes stop_codon:yes gene_type:complete